VTTGLAGGCTEAAGWGSSATDVWIACADANAGLGRIGHLSGGTWTQHDVGPTLLFGIWGSGPNDVRVAGTRGTVLFKGP
jgi:hypothetical protein